MRYILALLFLASSAFAQNVTYPYTSASSSGGITSLTNRQVEATNVQNDAIGPVQLASQVMYVTNGASYTIDVPAHTGVWFKVASVNANNPTTISMISVKLTGSSGGDAGKILLEYSPSAIGQPGRKINVVWYQTMTTNGFGGVGTDGGNIYVQITNLSHSIMSAYTLRAAGWCFENPDSVPTLSTITTNSIADPSASTISYMTPGSGIRYEYGAFDTLTLGGSNVMTSAGGSGAYTNVFPSDLYVGTPGVKLAGHDLGGGQHVFVIQATNGAYTDIQVLPPDATKQGASFSMIQDENGTTGALISMEWVCSTCAAPGQLSGFYVGTEAYGGSTSKPWSCTVTNGAYATFVPSGPMVIRANLLVGSSNGLSYGSISPLYVRSAATLVDLESTNSGDPISINFRSAGTHVAQVGMYPRSFGSATYTNALTISALDGGSILFGVGTGGGINDTVMRISQAGNVGIQNETPSEALDVTGSINASVGYKIGSTAGITVTQTYKNASDVIKTNIYRGGLLVGGISDL